MSGVIGLTNFFFVSQGVSPLGEATKSFDQTNPIVVEVENRDQESYLNRSDEKLETSYNIEPKLKTVSWTMNPTKVILFASSSKFFIDVYSLHL